MGNRTTPSPSSESQGCGARRVCRRPGGPRRAGLLLAAALAAVGWAGTARAGTVIVSRDSVIRTTGGPAGAGAFDLSDGTRDFGRFAEGVRSEDAVVGGTPGTEPPPSRAVDAEAHQYSVPGVMNGTLLDGAFAEGSVRADLNAAGATASAASHFDLTFRVTGTPASYYFGASMGTTGAGVVTADLLGVPAAAEGQEAPVPVFDERADAAAGDSQVIEQAGILEPGLYTLHVHADTRGTMDESSAYYSATLSLTPTPAAVPLPKAAWPGLGGLLALAGFTGLQSRRRRAEWQRACATDSIEVLVATGAAAVALVPMGIGREPVRFAAPAPRRAAA